MPIYEYQCTDCRHAFDCLQKVGEEPIKQCPQCNKNTVIRLVSAAGFQLKGNGWYATDFKTKPQNKSVSEDTTSSVDKVVTEKNTPEKPASTTTEKRGEKD